MSVALVVVALLAVAGAGLAGWLAARSAASTAQAGLQAVLDATLRLMERRPEVPEPLVMPAPDLTPYLEHLTAMATGMARELAAGISLVVAGPPQPAPHEQGEQAHEGEGPGDGGGDEDGELYVPAWDTDETWGIPEPVPSAPGEWSATWADAIHRSVGNGSDGGLFGGGGIHLPDNEGL